MHARHVESQHEAAAMHVHLAHATRWRLAGYSLDKLERSCSPECAYHSLRQEWQPHAIVFTPAIPMGS